MLKNVSHKVETGSKTSRIVMIICLILFAFAVILPAYASRSTLQDLFFIFTMLVLAQFWNLLAGYGGLVSIGQQAFVGIGAYALFGSIIMLNINPVPAILLGGIFALIIAIPIAFFAFRLQGAYFAIGTWVCAEVVRLVTSQWKQVGGGTGISMGRDARKEMWGTDWIAELFDVRASAARDILSYWLALALVVVTIGGIYWLLRTKKGLALAAVRDNLDAAKSVGVDAMKIKWMVFLISAFGTGLTGAVIYMQKARISPDAAFSLVDWTAFVLFIVIIGGIGTIEGPIIGILILFVLQTLFADFGTWYLILLGLIALIVMLFAPSGIWGLISNKTGVQLFPRRRHLTIKKKEK